MGLHYDLEFLNRGERWVPVEDKGRFDSYKFARDQFELGPEDFARSILPQGLLNLSTYESFVKHSKLLGYPRLLTIKTTDMVVGQPPGISIQADDKETEVVRDTRILTNFNYHLKQGLIDYSRFGVLLLRVFKDENGEAAITAWDPQGWVPVFYADGTKRVKYNVIGWVYEGLLTVQIHSTKDGSYEEREYAIDDTGIIGELIRTNTFNRKSGKRLFFAIPNTPTTTNPLGTGDYVIINGLLQKAMERLTAILRVLDEHADPSMTGPHSLLSHQEGSNEMVFKTNKFYAVGDEEREPKYLTWEANLESSFEAYKILMKEIYKLSEMGEAFLGTTEGVGNVVSGTAMRFKMISPLEKARRIQNDLTEPLKEVISSLLFIGKHTVEPRDINIAWRDSLPKDPRETAQLAKLESGSEAVKPLMNAIMDNFDIDLETAQLMVRDIIAERELLAGSKTDGRSYPEEGPVDNRKFGSNMQPASSENRGDDENEKLT